MTRRSDPDHGGRGIKALALDVGGPAQVCSPQCVPARPKTATDERSP
jgi:hypothetical protein